MAAWLLFWHWFLTWEVWIAPQFQVPGPIGDNVVMLWNLGWVKHALSHGSIGAWFPNAYYPEGFLFLWGTHTWLYGFLGWIVSPLMPNGYTGSILWANILMAGSTVATGLMGAAALRQWGVKRWPVILLVVSGVVFCWFRLFAFSGHYHFAGTEWMMASLAATSRARRLLIAGFNRTAYKWFGASGLLLGLTFLNDQTHAVFAIAITALILLKPIIRDWKSALGGGALTAACALALALVHLLPIAREAINGRFQYRVAMLEVPRLVDASSLILPGERHWLNTSGLVSLRAAGFAWAEGTYLGIIPLFLLALALFTAIQTIVGRRYPHWRRVQIGATAAALLFLMLALGDHLVVGRHSFFDLPGRLLRFIPVVNNIRLPQRWVWPAHLCIALAGGLALQPVFQYLETRLRPQIVRIAFMALAAIPAAEGKNYPPPAPADLRDPFLRPAHLVETVQRNYREGGVLLMPMEYAYAHSNVLQFMWGYEIPVVTAYTARAPFDVTATPWQGSDWTPESAEWLRRKNVRMIVFSFQSSEGLGHYEGWIKSARQAIPDLVVMDKNGRLL